LSSSRRVGASEGTWPFGEVRRPPAGGQQARVLAGAFAGYEGLVERYMLASDRVRLLLMLVGGGRRVEVEARQIRCAERRHRSRDIVAAGFSPRGGWGGCCCGVRGNR
jgi:hypothetical protein